MNLYVKLNKVCGMGLNFPYSETWLTWLFDAEINSIKKEIQEAENKRLHNPKR